MGARKNLNGKIVGRLTVINNGEPCIVGKLKRIRYKCKCECGNVVSILSSNLISPTPILSCGCLKRESTIKCTTTHNGSKTRLYNIWSNMKQRCLNNKVKHFKNYGGRGIYICSDWLDFSAFRAWSALNGYGESLSIERKDVNKGYSPENCCWINLNEQSNNTTKSVFITIDGVTKNMKQWACHYKVDYDKILWRYHRNKKLNIPFGEPEFIFLFNKYNKSLQSS